MDSNEQLELFHVEEPVSPNIDEVREQVAQASRDMMDARSASGSTVPDNERRVSEAAEDQGHGPQEWGVPLDSNGEPLPQRTAAAIAAQKAAAEKRRARLGKRENRFTDVGKDQPPAETAKVGEPASPEFVAGVMEQIRRDRASRLHEGIVRDAPGDPLRQIALSRARTEHEQPKLPNE